MSAQDPATVARDEAVAMLYRMTTDDRNAKAIRTERGWIYPPKPAFLARVLVYPVLRADGDVRRRGDVLVLEGEVADRDRVTRWVVELVRSLPHWLKENRSYSGLREFASSDSAKLPAYVSEVVEAVFGLARPERKPRPPAMTVAERVAKCKARRAELGPEAARWWLSKFLEECDEPRIARKALFEAYRSEMNSEWRDAWDEAVEEGAPAALYVLGPREFYAVANEVLGSPKRLRLVPGEQPERVYPLQP